MSLSSSDWLTGLGHVGKKSSIGGVKRREVLLG